MLVCASRANELLFAPRGAVRDEVRFRGTRKPTRETRALPGRKGRGVKKRKRRTPNEKAKAAAYAQGF